MSRFSIEEFIARINTIKKPGVELELRFLVDRRANNYNHVHVKYLNTNDTIAAAKMLIEKYKKQGCTQIVEQTINFIDEKNNIRCHFYKNGEPLKDKTIFYKKERLIDPIFILPRDPRAPLETNGAPAYRFSIAAEEKIAQFPVSQSVKARIKLRFSSCVSDAWRFDITLVKNIHGMSNADEIKQNRDNMFGANTPWDICDQIEFELEYVGALADFTLQNLAQADELWRAADTKINSAGINASYQLLIFQMATFMRPDIANKFKYGIFGVKQLGNAVIEINKNILQGTVLPNIDNYFVTDKVDGERTLIFARDENVYAVASKHEIIRGEIIQSLNFKGESIDILDTEFYNGKYYLFDVIIWEGANYMNRDFEERHKIFDAAAKKYDFIRLKPFLRLTEDYAREIRKMTKVKKEYEVDGLILTPGRDSQYNTMISYKIKSLDKLTVDFYVMKCPEKLLGIKPYIPANKANLFILTCGIDRNVCATLKMRPLKTLGIKIEKYFPIQFEPSDYEYAYLFWAAPGEVDEGRVYEFRLLYEGGADNPGDFTKWVDSRIYSQKNIWEMVKMREDRDIEIKRRTYYGNNYKIAETIWMNYHAPVTVDTIINLDKKAAAGYFQENDSDAHRASRSFNNYVKSQIFRGFSAAGWVLDMACGKGQDLFRYNDFRVQNLLGLEIDIAALQEFINRKHIISAKSEMPMSVRIARVNLNDDYLVNRERINSIKYKFPNEGFEIIVCNFAFHYFLADEAHVKNIIQFVHEQLRDNGRFIMTCFDGADVLDLLNQSTTGTKNSWETDIYGLALVKNAKTLDDCGQKLKVRLPFSRGEYYEEYLVNIDYIAQEFLKYNIHIEENRSFAEFLNDYPKLSNLTEDDKKYVSLYHYYSFTKNADRLNDTLFRVNMRGDEQKMSDSERKSDDKEN